MNPLDEIRASSVVAKSYEDQGYAVQIEPDPALVPFDLEGYRPDLLATRAGEWVLVEVKGPGRFPESARLRQVANIVDRHPEWRFEIVTLPDSVLTEGRMPPLETQEQIRSSMTRIDALLAQPSLSDFALLPLWSAYMAALRLALALDFEQASPVSDLSLINQSYSLGLLSHDSFVQAKRLLTLRNEAAHGLTRTVRPQDLTFLREEAEYQLADLEIRFAKESG